MASERRHVIVTGASSGIGQAVTETFFREGCRVAVVGRSTERLRDALSELLAEDASRLVLVEADIVDAAECERAAEEALAGLDGKLDVLVNNAGGAHITPGLGSIENFDWHFHLNTRAPFIFVQKTVGALEASEGCVINISSIAADRPLKGLLSYCTSKAALDHMTKCLALELAEKRVRCVAVSPATVRTNFHHSAGMSTEQASTLHEDRAGTHPIGRTGHPQEIADIVRFLSTATWVTGVSWVADGGRELTMASGLPSAAGKSKS